MDKQGSGRREVLPRWRSLQQTSRSELASIKQGKPLSKKQKELIEKLDRNFAETTSHDDAAELIESTITLGRSTNSLAAAKMVYYMRDSTKSLKKLAAAIINGAEPPVVSFPSPIETSFEVDQTGIISGRVRAALKETKAKLQKSPRNGLLALEIARIQFHHGQLDSAMHYAERAISSFPNDRYVLRSISCFFASRGEPDRALKYLRRSEGFEWDPWIQSAEIAVSHTIDENTKLPKRRIQEIRHMQDANSNNTELTAGLATMDLESGNRKMAKRLFETSMRAPNENSLAQLRWIQKDSDFAPTLQPGRIVTDAYEANTYEACQQEEPELAVRHAETWLNDQPFQTGPALLASSLCLSVLNDPLRAIATVDKALISQPDNLSLLNNKFVGLILSGQIDPASDVFNRWLNISREGQSLPFTYAAKGLMDFTLRKFDTGRMFYVDAMTSASENKDPVLVVMALIYWMDREYYHGLVSKRVVLEQVELIEKRLSKQFSLRKSVNMPLMAFKKRIFGTIDTNSNVDTLEVKKAADIGLNLLSSAVKTERSEIIEEKYPILM